MTNVLVLIVPMVKPVIWQTTAMVMNVQMVGNKDEFSFSLITFLVTYEKLDFFPRVYLNMLYDVFQIICFLHQSTIAPTHHV